MDPTRPWPRGRAAHSHDVSPAGHNIPKDDMPVAIYSGTDMEALFLKSLLEGSDIPASVSDLSFKGDVDVRVCVAQRDVERARPIVDHFRAHGKKTRHL